MSHIHASGVKYRKPTVALWLCNVPHPFVGKISCTRYALKMEDLLWSIVASARYAASSSVISNPLKTQSKWPEMTNCMKLQCCDPGSSVLKTNPLLLSVMSGLCCPEEIQGQVELARPNQRTENQLMIYRNVRKCINWQVELARPNQRTTTWCGMPNLENRDRRTSTVLLAVVLFMCMTQVCLRMWCLSENFKKSYNHGNDQESHGSIYI